MEDIVVGLAALLVAIFMGWFVRGRSEATKRAEQKAVAQARKEVIQDQVESQDDQTLIDRLTRRD